MNEALAALERDLAALYSPMGRGVAIDEERQTEERLGRAAG